MSDAEEAKDSTIWSQALTYVLAVAFFASGALKFVDGAAADANFAHLGFSAGLRPFIGIFELVGGPLLLTRGLGALSAVGLSIIMVGATMSHLIHDGVPRAAPALIMLGLLGWFLSLRGDELPD